MALVILTGASGSGKTAIARTIAAEHVGGVSVRHFDSIEIPPIEGMVAEYGSPEAWQRAMTLRWMASLAAEASRGGHILFEGQTRLSFLREGAAAVAGLRYTPLLIDCDDATRAQRLKDRGQPELGDENMMNWAGYLRREAMEYRCRILDTSNRPLEDCVSEVMALLTD
ncbi:AAA family ATPase [Rhizobium sp. BK251]|uniref:AAA family ATPase n=1 Tax=Rhizobium sp. BK251 TaxID=2512125 RepID=UPI001052DD24|nr:AAA family ATPase [Rhizobium sp. BK251]TCL62380.1 AAA domain-containing protein [Rhizobium sp. BK251]